jgi:hypothetical protein
MVYYYEGILNNKFLINFKFNILIATYVYYTK